LRGEVALARGDAPAAESAYRKMVEFAPKVPAGYLGLARIQAQRNAIDDAIGTLQQGERAIPDNNSLTAARAELLSRAARTDDSIAAFETLVKRAPDDEVFANNLAYQLIESKGDKTSLERALALTTRFKGSTNPGYLDTLGWAHYKLAQYPEAVPVLERAVQLAPNAPLLQLHLGMALCKSGNTAKSQDLIRKALAINAKLPGADEARKLLPG
jgi:predicted Zn-dependent protease